MPVLPSVICRCGAFAGVSAGGADTGNRPRRQQRSAGQEGGRMDKLTAIKSVAFMLEFFMDESF